MKINLYLTFILFLFVHQCSVLNAQSNSQCSGIINTLNKFQEGYTNRDTTVIDDYIQDLFVEDVVIIGTGPSEWITNIDMAHRLVLSDWKYWGDVKLDIDNAKIQIHNDVAWVAVKGTLTRNFESEDYIYNQYGLRDIRRIIDSENSNKTKLLEVITDAADILWEVELAGSKFIYPLRIGASLVHENGRWKFKQMHFSYPLPRDLILE
ncbi:MAG: hypothetical protein A2V66_16000 [Ignavibacteria bacterium RBG_13_36_8]|nr:MAG: hypothetical protein A2V66_16000 [Ignavibacteria bacterium RBG_13_36_8]